mgnify:CR=1 FL=1
MRPLFLLDVVVAKCCDAVAGSANVVVGVARRFVQHGHQPHVLLFVRTGLLVIDDLILPDDVPNVVDTSGEQVLHLYLVLAAS